MEIYEVVIGGTATLSDDPAIVAARLAELFKVSPERAADLLIGRHVIKREVDLPNAQRYQATLIGIGVRCEIQPSSKPVTEIATAGQPSSPRPAVRSNPLTSRTLAAGNRWNTGAGQSGPPPTSQLSPEAIPPGIKGWSWGAFLLNGIWAIGNRTWIGLLSFVPGIGFVMAFVLGFKGREWAWKAKAWDNVEHFNRVQRNWSIGGVVVSIAVTVISSASSGLYAWLESEQDADVGTSQVESPVVARAQTLPSTGSVNDVVGLPTTGSATAAAASTGSSESTQSPACAGAQCSTPVQPVGERLSRVFNGDMLNTRLAYFESVAGVARTTEGNRRSYRLDGCAISAAMAQGMVSSLRLEIKPSCQVDVTSFLSQGFSPSAQQAYTFGAFEQAMAGMEFYADCIAGCGNAVDPTVFGYWQGPHSLDFREVLLEVALTDDAAINAALRWQDTMEKAKGEDWVTSTRFNCDRTFDSVAQQAFSAVQITAITIGVGLTKPGCE